MMRDGIELSLLNNQVTVWIALPPKPMKDFTKPEGRAGMKHRE
jgi:hypothetical protein